MYTTIIFVNPVVRMENEYYGLTGKYGVYPIDQETV
jgi:hypothetical protein